MLFRKVGAAKEEGRLKEDSLSETLRVLEETATGLGKSKTQNAHKFLKTNPHTQCTKNELLVRAQINTGELMSDQNSDRKCVTQLFEDNGTGGGGSGLIKVLQIDYAVCSQRLSKYYFVLK